MTSSSASTAARCWTYDYNFDSGSDLDNISDDSLTKRDYHGITVCRGLGDLSFSQGHSKPVSVIGSTTMCTLSFKGAASAVTIPAYPRATDLETHAPSGAKYWYVPTTSATRGGCPTLAMTSFPNVAALTAASVMIGLAGGSGVYKLGSTKSLLMNVDHVYELKFFKNFFNSLIDDGQITCSGFNDFFMAEDASAGTNVPRY